MKNMKVITPLLEAVYVNLTETEKITLDGKTRDTGKFSVTLRVDPKEHKDFVSQIEEAQLKCREHVTSQSDTAGDKPFVAFRKEQRKNESGTKVETGKLLVKFKSGKDFPPVIHNAQNNMIAPEEVVFGSKVMCEVSIKPFKFGNWFGGTMYLGAIGLIEKGVGGAGEELWGKMAELNEANQEKASGFAPADPDDDIPF